MRNLGVWLDSRLHYSTHLTHANLPFIQSPSHSYRNLNRSTESLGYCNGLLFGLPYSRIIKGRGGKRAPFFFWGGGVSLPFFRSAIGIILFSFSFSC